jgi:hypothetical protein
VSNTLYQSRANLEKTLCSLPAGVAPYYQTSSWGQWFNVRVTTVVFKDNNGNVISSADEGADSRGATSGKVYSCGPWTPKNARNPRPGQTHGSTGLDSFIDFVTSRSVA